jgi:putative oxidoreductase
MKIVVLIARILLGLVFLVFGANKIVTFMPASMPTGVAGQFIGAMVSTKYMIFVGLCESVSGLLLLANRYVPLALTIVGPVIVNILLVGLLMSPIALPSGIIVTILWFVVFWSVRSAFSGIFQQRVQSSAS